MKGLVLAVGALLIIATVGCDDSDGDKSDTTIGDVGGDEATVDTVAVDTTADTTAGDSSGGETTANDTSSPPDQVQSDCDHNGFHMVEDRVTIDVDMLMYIAETAEEEPLDVMSIELWADELPAPGSYALGDTEDEQNYATCSRCVVVSLQCQGDTCSKDFFATSGTLTITALGGTEQRFAGSLSDVTLVEVTIDDEWYSTPVAEGETYCISSYAFDAGDVPCTSADECEGYVCDVPSGECVVCSGHEQCTGNPFGDYCDPMMGFCVECVESEHCEGTEVCDYGECVPACTQLSDCDYGVCDEATGECVECLQAGDCEEGHCDTEEQRCVECLETSHCEANETLKYCSSGWCVECIEADHCTSPEVCTEYHYCDAP